MGFWQVRYDDKSSSPPLKWRVAISIGQPPTAPAMEGTDPFQWVGLHLLQNSDSTSSFNQLNAVHLHGLKNKTSHKHHYVPPPIENGANIQNLSNYSKMMQCLWYDSYCVLFPISHIQQLISIYAFGVLPFPSPSSWTQGGARCHRSHQRGRKRSLRSSCCHHVKTPSSHSGLATLFRWNDLATTRQFRASMIFIWPAVLLESTDGAMSSGMMVQDCI